MTVLPQSLLPFAFSMVQVVESSLGSAQSSRGSFPAWGCSFWTPSVRISGPACFRWPGPGTWPRVCAYCPLDSASLVVSKINVFQLKSLFSVENWGLVLSGKGLKQEAVRKLSMATAKLRLPQSIWVILPFSNP